MARWDPLIEQLHALRRRAGEPSYAEIARRITEQRLADGTPEHAAGIARSSVHDAFRLGRSRINLGLTREIVVAIGADPVVVDDWVAECEAPARVVEPEAVPELPEIDRGQAWMLMVACVALNLVGRMFVDFFHLPIYLDMVGTAVVAIALGPWRGAAVGASTNVLGVVVSGWVSLPFALVNVVGALVWGYGVRRYGMGRTLPRFFVLNVVAAVACSAVAVPILLTLYGASFRDGHDLITELVARSIAQPELAATVSNLMTSLADKMICGYLALVIVSALPVAIRARSALVPAGGA